MTDKNPPSLLDSAWQIGQQLERNQAQHEWVARRWWTFRAWAMMRGWQA